jgi:putative PIG3 family NAD(P)H quinone oxidoreductase
MKAVLIDDFGGPEVLRIGECEAPLPGIGQVLIKVAATSVNRPDIIQRQGNYPAPKGESEILGLEVAGVIEALGVGVVGYAVGQRVMALVGGGGYAEYVAAHAGHLMAIPDSMSDAQAACVCETYITAFLNIFMLAALQDGEAILIHGGGGGVSTAAIQLCKTLRADVQVIVTASSGKVERVRELGADVVIDYRTQRFADEVKAATGGQGVAVILDHIGGRYLADNLKSLAVGGRLIIIGVMGGIKAELNLAVMMVKRQHIIGSVLRSRPLQEKSAIIHEFAQTVLPRLADQTIAPLIHRVFPLEEVAEAHRLMEESSHFGKIVLEI